MIIDRTFTRQIAGNPSSTLSGAIVRVPARRIENAAGPARLLHDYFIVERGAVVAEGSAVLNELPKSVRQLPLVLVLSAEDVLLTEAKVPPLSTGRLREALPNLIEDRTLADVATLHVAQLRARADAGEVKVAGAMEPLAVIDRAWFEGVLSRFSALGYKVGTVLPEALCVPFSTDAWSLACIEPRREGLVAIGDAAQVSDLRLWVRTGRYRAYSLPPAIGAEGSESAARMLESMLAQSVAEGAPLALNLFAVEGRRAEMLQVAEAATRSRSENAAAHVPRARESAGEPAPPHLAHQVASDLASHVTFTPGDPLRSWIEGAPSSLPRSLLQHEFERSIFGTAALSQWKRVAALVLALLVLQLVGMQVRWSQLRAERAELRIRSEAALKTAFPETTTILDAPLQMGRALAGLRAQGGQSDPGDFITMVAAAGLIFADAPANAFRGLVYGGESGPDAAQSRAMPALKIRLAPGTAVSAEQRSSVAQRAEAAGYELRFETNAAASGAGLSAASVNPSSSPGEKPGAGETIASMRPKVARAPS